MFAKELMTVEPRAVTIHETATHAARLMAQYDVGILPGVDDPLHRRLAIAQEAGAQQQVFRRIAAERQFREQHQVRAVFVARLGDHRGDARFVAGDVADGEIALGQGEAQGHGDRPVVAC